MSTPDSRPGYRSRLPKSRLTIIGGMMALLAACASQPTEYMLAQRDLVMQGCPTGSVRACEIIGGNKFRKRYGRCACVRDDF